ncbi:serine/threonine protein kinase [Phormidesmis priestleyi ULC007]|uniref:non-specific serine/threonine protein kinase n=2 Tax=Phormidesmis priestleyi TaxID=268141 RepID=A0A2T1DE15_9CYAN|nr:serine/threonine-protein kinase [Phormidesmis priestleyi]PSB18706.1 serine/threonine protein kinase [Phormidesmis priestleyi ULC007]PZO51534.1 MAG: serine/threonine protein kinase [Phormidesmis priestleyi]
MQTEMVSSISLGTLLRQRYLIKQVLGQGGFGRTYLAIDQERFNEPCVLKEFTVPYQDDALVEKAKTLFQREASTLYQIQHPQIPRFWAAFEDEQRLFLVQDFVKGQTYRSLLQARKQKGQAFSETEVLHLLNYLLPVLSYLHDRDIVHRDISPENIILRSHNQGFEQLFGQPASENLPVELPVLIDFGAVKEAASHWPIVSSITRVGKVGYAPPEQLQTGNVSPHSDLYALGATSLVLLTGREPQGLLDSQTLAWQWQPYAKISGLLALVLQKMLALQPGDRYQSARETWADLQPLMEAMQRTLLNPMLSPPQLDNRDIAPASRDRASPQVTTIKTQLYMTAHNQDSASSQPLKKVSSSQLKQPRNQGIGAAIAASLLATLGIGTHLFKVTLPLGSTQQTISLPAKEVASNTVSSSNSQPQRIEFLSGETSMVIPGNLQDDPKLYVLEATQGQLMTATLDGSSGVIMSVLRANQQGVDTAAHQTRNWTGRLPATEQYTIQVSGNGVYSLDISITPLSRSDYSDTQVIKFDRGKSATTVTGKVEANHKRQYLLKAKSRQIMAVKVVAGEVNFSAIAPNGQRIGGSSKSRDWQGRLRTDGEYTLEVSSTKAENFALSVEVY